jgi:hypothetical protein
MSRFERKFDTSNGITFAAIAKDWKKLSYFFQEEFYAAENAYNEAADYLQISKFAEADSSESDGGINSIIHDETKSFSLKLPRIAIPTFPGKFSEWKNFRHTFESLVDSNDAMSNILKFHYLKSSVTGNANIVDR